MDRMNELFERMMEGGVDSNLLGSSTLAGTKVTLTTTRDERIEQHFKEVRELELLQRGKHAVKWTDSSVRKPLTNIRAKLPEINHLVPITITELRVGSALFWKSSLLHGAGTLLNNYVGNDAN